MAGILRFYLFLFIFQITTIGCLGQLAGTYSVGGNAADFPDPLYALYMVKNHGTTDTVIFEINDGVYVGNYNLQHVLSDYPVVLRSLHGINGDVVIKPTGISVHFSGAKNLHFKHLTFDATDSQVALRFSYSCRIRLDSCILIAGGQYHDCLYMSTSGGNTCSGDFYMRGNSFLNGDVVAEGGNYGVAENNFFSRGSSFNGNFQVIRNNTFNSSPGFNTGYNVNSPLLFEYNKVLQGGVSFSFSSNIVVAHNLFYGHSSLSFTNNIKFYGNDQRGYISMSGMGALVYNNYFHSGVHIHSEWNSITRIFGNNFGLESYLYIRNINTIKEVINNNLSQPILWVSWPDNYATNKVRNNNSWPQPGTVGINESHIDPQYISDTLLRATNPMLSAIGYPYIPMVYEDFDGIPRKNLPSIGANELCMSADTVTISCSSYVGTHLCSLNGVDDFTIEPAEYVEYGSYPYPRLRPVTNTLFYFYSPGGSVLDSLFVQVDPYDFSLKDDVTVDCGLPAYLYNKILPTDATLTWTSGAELVLHGNSNLYYTFVDTITTFTAELSIPGCGTYTDTIVVSVNYAPLAAFTYDYLDLDSVVYFHSNELCVDSVFWNFGDDIGSTSSEFHPAHTYTSMGFYTVSLEAYNDNGMADTVSHVVALYFNTPDGLSDIQKDDFVVYPNPTTGKCFVKMSQTDKVDFSLYSLDGKQLLRKESLMPDHNNLLEINMTKIDPGIYILVAINSKDIYTCKVVKE